MKIFTFMFKVGIVGAEKTGTYDKFEEKCIFYLREKAEEGLSFFTFGDEYVHKFAFKYRINVQDFKPLFRNYDNPVEALKKRNEELLSSCDALIIFSSTYKEYQILANMAAKRGIPYRMPKL